MYFRPDRIPQRRLRVIITAPDGFELELDESLSLDIQSEKTNSVIPTTATVNVIGLTQYESNLLLSRCRDFGVKEIMKRGVVVMFKKINIPHGKRE